MDKKCILLGIVGDSATGKTTLTRGIVNLLGPENVTAICTDDYHKYNRKQRKELGITALHPDCNHIDIMEQHLRDLRAGRPILKPNYNHTTGDFDPPTYVKPARFVIVEGLLGYHTRILRDQFDVKVFLDPPEALRRQWKVARDTAKRGYTPEQVLAALDAREADSAAFIRPQKKYADIVVHFYPKQKTSNDARLNAKIGLSPARPCEELSNIIEQIVEEFKDYPCERGSGTPCLHMSLEKWNGRPFEVLDIHGEIDEVQTNMLKMRLGELIRARNFELNMDEVGLFQKNDQVMISYPLALAQLVISYFMINTSLEVIPQPSSLRLSG